MRGIKHVFLSYTPNNREKRKKKGGGKENPRINPSNIYPSPFSPPSFSSLFCPFVCVKSVFFLLRPSAVKSASFLPPPLDSRQANSDRGEAPLQTRKGKKKLERKGRDWHQSVKGRGKENREEEEEEEDKHFSHTKGEKKRENCH